MFFFALAWHWHLRWQRHSWRPSYRVGQWPSLIRRRIPWGILRMVPWLLWSVVIRRLCWCWCSLWKNWWLCCKNTAEKLQQGSKIRSWLKKKEKVLVPLDVQYLQSLHDKMSSTCYLPPWIFRMCLPKMHKQCTEFLWMCKKLQITLFQTLQKHQNLASSWMKK